jgi:lysophospholipase L1-like esterase
MRVCFFGDSIVHGQGDAAGLGWVGRLQSQLRSTARLVDLYNLGIGSDTSEGVRGRWQAEYERRIVPGVPNALMLAVGVNDATRRDGAPPRVALADSAANLRAILGAARDLGPVLFASTLPIDPARMPIRNSAGQMQMRDNAEIAVYVRAHLEICAALGVPALDLFTAMARVPSWPAELADGIHPNADGHARIAATVAAWPAWRMLVGLP